MFLQHADQSCCRCVLLQCVQTEASPARRVLLGRALQEVIHGVTSVSQQNHKSQQAVPTACPASGGGTGVQQQQAASDAAMQELLVRVPAAACLTSVRCLDAVLPHRAPAELQFV